MKLLTYSPDPHARQRLGVYLGDGRVLDVAAAYEQTYRGRAPDWFESVGALLAGGDGALSLVREVVQRVDGSADPARGLANRLSAGSLIHAEDEIVFRPPTHAAAKVLCVTMNYMSHAQASLTKPSEDPYFFIKMPGLLTPHRGAVLLSRTSQQCDNEIELAVIIGRRGKYIAREAAMDHVAGYTVGNDFSFRDRRTLKSDPNSARLNWLTLKNLDTAAPLGPWLVTKDEVGDATDLDITVVLENEPQERHVGNTSGMMHSIPDLIYHASDGLTLEPGDVILTGTPHPVAFGHGRFLKDGDIVRAEIEKIGALVNPMKRES
jgi:2-keto-4-pentenoate hydratase/2-oxohepta-3-ene-1,7-dioic acid hydratase in catechol pathway